MHPFRTPPSPALLPPIAGLLALLALLPPGLAGAPAAGHAPARSAGDDGLELGLEPRGHAALPSPAQLALHGLELGVLVDFGLATVARGERPGEASPLLFHPDRLDARAWAEAARAAGARLLVLTVREPSGFCLWPSAASDNTVAATPWRDGRGDLVREVVDACRGAGLAVGFRLSAADLSAGVAATAGRPGERRAIGAREEHLERLLEQIGELCTGYGPLALVWIEEALDPFGWDVLDAATAERVGTGPGERIAALVHALQPGAVLLGTPFPGARLLSGERGFAPDPLRYALGPGEEPRLRPGHAGWTVPLSVARPRDPGKRLHGPLQLLESWHRSAGAGAVLLYALEIDPEGRIPADHLEALAGAGRGLAWLHAPHPARDLVLAWGETRHPLVDLGQPRPVDRVVLGEHLELGGQRVRAHVLEAEVDGRWQPIARGTTIGHLRVHAFDQLLTQRIRLRVTESDGEPALRRMTAHDSQQR